MTKLIRFMVPILGVLTLQVMYGAINLLVVGQFGTDAGMLAVATGSNIINLMVSIITSLTVGTTVLISRYLGEGRADRVESAIRGYICPFAVFTTVAMVLLLASASVFASWLSAPAPAYEMTIEYVRICGAGTIFVVAYNVISGISKGLGNSEPPLVFVSIACSVNIMGDLFFVAILHMNVAGTTFATILAQIVSMVLSLSIIRRQNLPFTVIRQDLYFNSKIPVFLKLGISLALREPLTSISFLIPCAIVNDIGLEVSSGYRITQKAIFFIVLIPSALTQPMSAFIAQNVSAGREERARKAMLTGMGLGASVGMIILLTSFLRGDIPASVFATDEAYIVRAMEYPRGFSFEATLICLVFGYIGYFNGHGMSLPITVQGITASFLVRVSLSYSFNLEEDASLFDIGLVVPATSLYGILFFIICYIWYVRKRG